MKQQKNSPAGPDMVMPVTLVAGVLAMTLVFTLAL